jgi:hypothetical protein
MRACKIIEKKKNNNNNENKKKKNKLEEHARFTGREVFVYVTRFPSVS